MTVTELIEALQQLSGDPDLRTVRLMVTISRPYAKDVRVDGGVWGVSVQRDVAAITGVVHLEG